MSPRFIQALKSLGAQHLTKQHHVQPIIEQQPPIITSSSTTTVAINILQDLLSDIKYTISDIKLSISQTLTLHDKSQSEILFLLAILLTILLFVVILPIYEAITDDEEVNEIRNKVEKEVPSISTPLKMYKPGVGIVEVTYDSEPSLLRMSSSDTSNGSSGSDRSLNGSICTHHSLETIEESEEEYLQEEESEGVPGLNTTGVDDEEEEETVDDKYDEFLSFCNSDD